MNGNLSRLLALLILTSVIGCGTLLDWKDDQMGTTDRRKNGTTYGYRDFWGQKYYVSYSGHASVAVSNITDLNYPPEEGPSP